MFCIDDLRPQLGCYGYDLMKTPHIDQLAANGMLFERAYCNVPVCGPSRISIMTGISTNRKTSKTSSLKQDFVTLPATLKANGYHTISNGKVFHFFDDRKQDWTEPPWRAGEKPIRYKGKEPWAKYNVHRLWQDPEAAHHINPENGFGPFYDCADVPDNAYQDGKIADKTIADIERLSQSGKPFFIACGFWRPHLPFNAPKKYWDLYDRENIKIADNQYRPKDLPEICVTSPEFLEYAAIEGYPDGMDFHRKARHGYYASVSYVDSQIGKVLKTLEELDLRKNTIVLLWGDHGYHLGEHSFWSKHNTLHNALHAPLIISAPGFAPGKTNALVEFIDIYPTLMDLAGIEIPETVEGDSLQPLLLNPDHPLKEAVFCNWLDKETIAGQTTLILARTVKTNRYIYTEWIKQGKVAYSMLFDHEKDPDENNNVVGHSAYKAVVTRMKGLLKRQYSL